MRVYVFKIISVENVGNDVMKTNVMTKGDLLLLRVTSHGDSNYGIVALEKKQERGAVSV
jgi:hypothetical protein